MKKIIMYDLETDKTAIVGIHLGKLVVAEYTSAYKTQRYEISFGKKHLSAERYCGRTTGDFALAAGVFKQFEGMADGRGMVIKYAPKGFTIEGYYNYVIELTKEEALDPDSYKG